MQGGGGGWKKPTNVCPIDETEEVEKGDGRDDVEIDLQPESTLGLLVEDDERTAMPMMMMMSIFVDVYFFFFFCTIEIEIETYLSVAVWPMAAI